MKSLSTQPAICGIGELKPERRTDGVTTMELLARVSKKAVEDAGLEPREIDGVLMGPQVGETPQHVPATLCEYLGLQPTMANVVDLGGASGPGMIWGVPQPRSKRACARPFFVCSATTATALPRGHRTATPSVNSTFPSEHRGQICPMRCSCRRIWRPMAVRRKTTH